MEKGFSGKIYKKLTEVPPGKVTTYRDLAVAIGRPDASRAAGNALNKNPYAPKIPCHRVVKKSGEVGGYAGGTEKKIKLLKKEGVDIKKGKIVNFQEKLYKF